MDITEILKPECMTLELIASDKISAIKEMITMLKNAGIVSDEAGMFEAVMAREGEFATDVGFGIAIPHAQCQWVTESAVAFGRLPKDINWSDQEEDSAIRMIFMIAVPLETQDEHLRILAHIARRLMDEEVRQGILRAVDSQSIIEALKS